MVAGSSTRISSGYRGIPQSYYVDEFIDLEADPHRGYVLMPIIGFPVLDRRQPAGLRPRALPLAEDLARMAGLLVLLHDRSAGRVESGASLSRPRIRYTLEDEDRRQLAEGLVHCCEVLLAAGAREVLVPYWIDPLVLRPRRRSRARSLRAACARARSRSRRRTRNPPAGWAATRGHRS